MPGFYNIVVPIGADRRNLNPNPSFETGTAGWGTVQAGTVGTTSAVQAFGAWCGSVATTSNGTTGAMAPIFTAGNGTAYTYSFYGSFPSGSTFRAGISDSNGANLISGSFIGTGYGQWFRYSGTWTEASGAARRLTVRKNSDTNAYAFYLDAVQYEAGSITTYIDGDQGNGYVWDGQPHASSSVRAASVRTGGTVYPLADLDFLVLEHDGVGMPDMTPVLQDYAFVAGAFYQRTHTNARSFLLTGLMSGTTFQDLHAIRQQVINTIKPDVTAEPQPFRIIYTGAGGSVYIDGVYDSGMQLKTPDGFSETAAVRFVAPDPYWQTITERGTSLAPFVTFGSANFLLKRDPNWQWGTLGVQGTTTNAAILALAYQNGTVFFGGGFSTISGTVGGRLGMLFPNGSFGTMGGTVGGGTVAAIAALPTGTIVFGGGFTQISGVSNVRNIAQWSNAGFGTLSGGTVTGTVTSMVQALNSLYIGGSYTYDASTRHFARWSSLTNYVTVGTPDQPVAVVGAGQDGRVFVGFNGGVTGTVLAQGTRIWGVGVYRIAGNTWGTTYGGISLGRAEVITVDSAGNAYVGGHFSVAGVGSAGNVAVFRDPAWSAVGSNLGGVFADEDPLVGALAIDPRTGALYGAGDRAELQINLGGTWGRLGFNRSNIMALLFTPDRTLYMATDTGGAGTLAAVTQIVNPGAAQTPIKLRVTSPDNAQTTILHLVNATTDRGIYFGGPAPDLDPGEVAILDTTPDRVSYRSSLRSNRLSDILPGSNLSQWQLLSGTNYVSIYATPGTARIDLIYRPRFWSSDGSQS